MIRARRLSSGRSMIEMLIAISLLLVLGVLAKSGLDLFSNMSRQKYILEAERDTEMLMTLLEKDVLNSKAIVTISSNTFSLHMYDFSLGYDNPTMFSSVNLGTVTYNVSTNGEGVTSVQRTFLYPTGRTGARNFLAQYIENPQTTDPIFSPRFAGELSPFTGLNVNIPLKPPFWKDRKSKELKLSIFKLYNNE